MRYYVCATNLVTDRVDYLGETDTKSRDEAIQELGGGYSPEFYAVWATTNPNNVPPEEEAVADDDDGDEIFEE